MPPFDKYKYRLAKPGWCVEDLCGSGGIKYHYFQQT